VILAALLLIAQDIPTPAPEVTEGEEIVVRATFGRTTMLFDKGSDGRLRNCRIMVSSGSQKRDTDACKATPVCYAKTADEVTDCVELAAVEPVLPLPKPVNASTAPVFDIPQLVRPRSAPSPDLAGPIENTEESRETERQRVKKITPPKNPASDGPAIRITNGNAKDQ
jgi:hypothetical protein